MEGPPARGVTTGDGNASHAGEGVPQAGGGAPHPDDSARPPLGSWSRLYALVIAALAASIGFLLWLTERYR